jgi:hypothetical protein
MPPIKGLAPNEGPGHANKFVQLLFPCIAGWMVDTGRAVGFSTAFPTRLRAFASSLRRMTRRLCE